jgi:BirA family biotin operon repressor/biotin-[acetyl-CoA-carboxylase] ligase
LLNFTVHEYVTLGSTNDEAKALLKQGAREGTVVKASTQTAGRGRRGRQWISEPGNLYFSFILEPECSLVQASQLSFVVAIAVGEAILPFLKTPDILSYKWPNDLLLNKEKVAGILIETESDGGQMVDACVVGIGVNLNALPNHPAYPVTTLNQHTTTNVSLDLLFLDILEQIKKYYQIWKQVGFGPIREKWLEPAHSLGQNLSITVGEATICGKFNGLSQDGALLLEREDGFVQKFMSAEVI